LETVAQINRHTLRRPADNPDLSQKLLAELAPIIYKELKATA
jgi:hypothetical protein